MILKFSVTKIGGKGKAKIHCFKQEVKNYELALKELNSMYEGKSGYAFFYMGAFK